MAWEPCPNCRGYLFVYEAEDLDRADRPAQYDAEHALRSGSVLHGPEVREHQRPHEPQVTDIPDEERRTVELTLSAAMEHAAAGKESAGYTLLIQEMARVEKLVAGGEPWAGALLEKWRDAIDRFGVCFQDEDDEQEALLASRSDE